MRFAGKTKNRGEIAVGGHVRRGGVFGWVIIETDILKYNGATSMPKPNDVRHFVPCARIYYDVFEAFLEERHDMWEVYHYRCNEKGRFGLNKIFDFKDTGNHDDTVNTLIEMMLKYRTTYENQCEGITDYE